MLPLVSNANSFTLVEINPVKIYFKRYLLIFSTIFGNYWSYCLSLSMLKVDAALGSRQVTQAQRTRNIWDFVIDYIAKIAVHHLLQASAFLSISTIHVKTRLNQISCAEESSQAAFPINNVTLFREKQEKMWNSCKIW